MYMCVRAVNFVFFYDFSIEFWNCPDNVIFLFLISRILDVIRRKLIQIVILSNISLHSIIGPNNISLIKKKVALSAKIVNFCYA